MVGVTLNETTFLLCRFEPPPPHLSLAGHGCLFLLSGGWVRDGLGVQSKILNNKVRFNLTFSIPDIK